MRKYSNKPVSSFVLLLILGIILSLFFFSAKDYAVFDFLSNTTGGSKPFGTIYEVRLGYISIVLAVLRTLSLFCLLSSVSGLIMKFVTREKK